MSNKKIVLTLGIFVFALIFVFTGTKKVLADGEILVSNVNGKEISIKYSDKQPEDTDFGYCYDVFVDNQKVKTSGDTGPICFYYEGAFNGNYSSHYIKSKTVEFYTTDSSDWIVFVNKYYESNNAFTQPFILEEYFFNITNGKVYSVHSDNSYSEIYKSCVNSRALILNIGNDVHGIGEEHDLNTCGKDDRPLLKGLVSVYLGDDRVDNTYWLDQDRGLSCDYDSTEFGDVCVAEKRFVGFSPDFTKLYFTVGSDYLTADGSTKNWRDNFIWNLQSNSITSGVAGTMLQTNFVKQVEVSIAPFGTEEPSNVFTKPASMQAMFYFKDYYLIDFQIDQGNYLVVYADNDNKKIYVNLNGKTISTGFNGKDYPDIFPAKLNGSNWMIAFADIAGHTKYIYNNKVVAESDDVDSSHTKMMPYDNNFMVLFCKTYESNDCTFYYNGRQKHLGGTSWVEVYKKGFLISYYKVENPDDKNKRRGDDHYIVTNKVDIGPLDDKDFKEVLQDTRSAEYVDPGLYTIKAKDNKVTINGKDYPDCALGAKKVSGEHWMILCEKGDDKFSVIVDGHDLGIYNNTDYDPNDPSNSPYYYVEHFIQLDSQGTWAIKYKENAYSALKIGNYNDLSNYPVVFSVQKQGTSATATNSNTNKNKNKNQSFAQKQAGKILLQVENNGEAWYVDTVSLRRYYLKDGPTAYNALREFGLGITNADLSKIPVGIEDRAIGTDSDGDKLDDKTEEALGTNPNDNDSDNDGYDDGTEVRGNYNPRGEGRLSKDNNLISRMEGKILLQVEGNGEAWYVHNGKRYYMANGDFAYQIMRFLSLGITNSNLGQIEEGNL